jgi:tetratricopeptide (TPR) repeat protein
MPTYQEALRLSRSGKFHEAVCQFKLLVSQSADSREKANFLLEEADCHRQLGQFEQANACVNEAKTLTGCESLDAAQVNYFEATLLIAQDRTEEGLQALSIIENKFPNELAGPEGRELHERIDLERAFALIKLGRYADARVVLERVIRFPVSDEYRTDVHCHLARCYFELGHYALAREQSELVEKLGPSDDWAATFHYYFGYTLYELKEFALARRQLLLCLQSGLDGPPQSYVYKLLAAVYRKLGETNKARQYMSAARRS